MKVALMDHGNNLPDTHGGNSSARLLTCQRVRQRFAFALGLGLLAQFVQAQSPLPDEFNPGANDRVHSIVLQADGRILVGGWFTKVGGLARQCLARLDTNGTVDPDFKADARGGPSSLPTIVYGLAIQLDGKILVSGNFISLGGQPRLRIARLNADGNVDMDFHPDANNSVIPMVVQADGKILVGGNFTQLGGQPRTNLARLLPDGNVDLPFNPGANSEVDAFAVQTDGKILVGGKFTTLGGQPRNRIARLNADGNLDPDFNPGAAGGSFGTTVYGLAVQADGKILVGGTFTSINDTPRNQIARLNSNGTLDEEFNPGAPGGATCVDSWFLQADGKILVSGIFTQLGGQSHTNVARLNPDGTVDSGFDPGADWNRNTNMLISALAIQADGRVVMGGLFNKLGGLPRTNLARVYNSEPAIQSLACTDSTVTWLRGGTSPEVWRTEFELSTNGITWTYLGAGSRIPGGWQLAGLALPASGTIRVRGQVANGQLSTCWFVESRLAFGDLPASSLKLLLSKIDGVPSLQVTGQVGEPFTLECSAAFPITSGWLSLPSCVLTTSPQTIVDFASTNAVQQFFRARYGP